MKVSDLQHGQVVRARWGRAGENAPNWCEWTDVSLHVQRHQGCVTLVALQRVDWAEATPRDFCPPDEFSPNGMFLVEDYYLEIEGLVAL